ncbi:unnamed protein product [Rotaria sp. Silwood1]|nr:unnamed protein product [Rotaria sp. Silwood1]CAF4510761.1 unnamed protein product [Rotaria sp. Silwood1]CAF4671470.1 unnamed protein product [Rotaria sp. Silwood1]
MNTNYPSIISVDHESNPRLYETTYNNYSPYTDYAATSKLEAFDYNYWPGTPATHNILTIPPTSTTNQIIDQIQTSPSTNQTIETLVPGSTVHLSQINSTATISATHHHHHIHQHLYPAPSSSNDSPNWLTPTEYQSPNNYRHYTYTNNNFYDQSQWTTPPPTSSSLAPIKFESPYSPPSYFESSHNIDQPLSDSKEEPSNSSYTKCQEQQSNWFKSQLTPTPPKNPANGKTRTRDKYRIVYTDRQRYELENEFTISKYISIPRKAALSSALALSERQIKIWFQNRRAKERKLNKKRQEICSRQLNNSTDADSPSDGGLESPTYYQNYVSYDFLQQQQQQPKSAAAEMDPSVLWCLGPDFDKQTVLSLLSDNNSIDSGFMQPTTPTWWMSSPSQWNISSIHEPPIYTPRSVMSELGPQSPTNSATKRPFSDVSNRTTIGRSFASNQPTTKLEFSTPVRSLTPDLYSRVPSSIKRSRITPALTSSSLYETPPPPAPLPPVGSTVDSAERALEIALLLKEHPDCTCVLVTLIQEYQSRFQKPLHAHLEQPYCIIHCPKNFIVNPDLDLPFVQIPFSLFADNIRQLLTQHNGSMPLASFPQCYNHTFEPLYDHNEGVPLEHYISCIKDIQIVTGQGVIKKVQFSNTPGLSFMPTTFDTSNMHVDMCAEVQQRLQQFSREVLDLLKNQGFHCRLPVSKFVSAYHQYFSRQCRVADYGFSKIIDLLLAIPKSVQILGDGNKRIMTITHRCQMKRFTNDIIRILKNKPQRSMSISEIPIEYEIAYKKPFYVADFGMCYLEDLVNEVKDNKELVVEADKHIIKLYRKERTDLEIYATRNFEKDVIDMLRILPDFSIPFQKFIPSYHHHFGYQCKVQTYGFSRLIDLLEELSHVVKINEDKNGEKIVQLTPSMMAHAILLNIEQLVRKYHGPLRIQDLQAQYLQVYRNELNPEDFGVASIEALLLTMTDKLDFHYTETDIILAMKEPSPATIQLAKNVILTLMLSQCQLSFWQLKQDMLVRFKQDVTLNMCRNELRDYVEVIDQTVRLTPPMCFAYNVVLLLSPCDGRMAYDDFIVEYQRRTGSTHLLYPTDYGFPTMPRLFDAIQLVAQVRGRRNFKIIILNPEFRRTLLYDN